MERLDLSKEPQDSVEPLSRRTIIENESLADMATGIEHHPSPLTQEGPLVDATTQSREFPYSR